jgi:hypothetical protein
VNPNQIAETLTAFRKAYESPIADPRMSDILQKSTFSQSGTATSGLTFYDLELGAKFLYPVLTPLRNTMPRVSGKGGIQANWRAVTAINTSGVRLGVSGGNRGGVIAVSTQDYTAAYKGIGLEDNVDFEAQYAGMGFDDVRAIAAKTLLEATMIGEELLILGGCSSVSIGQGGTPTLTGSSTGGTLAAQTWSVIVAPLTLDGYINGSVTGGVQGQIVRTNADGSSDTFGGGTGKLSASATVTTSGATSSIAATTTTTSGALGYAWFWGAAGSELLGAITSINSLVITAAATGTQTAASLGTNDNSANTLVFDGLLTQVVKTGSNSYYSAQATGTAGTGTGLTSDNEGGIVEVDVALKHFWDVYRLSPTVIYVNSQEALNISKKILVGGSATSNLRFNVDVKDGMIAGGVMIKEYLNRFSMAGGQLIPVKIHPNMPPGTILFYTERLPYPLSNVSNVAQIRTRQDYYQIEWPLVSRKYQYGVYADEVLQHYFPPSMGIITNIGNN